MNSRITRVHNPVATANNRRPQTFKPSKGKGSHNRQKDEQNASKHEKDAYQKGEQEST
jgi:hypothetical protein